MGAHTIFKNKTKQDVQVLVTSRHIRATTVAMEKRSIAYSERVFVTLVIQHTMHKCHIVIFDLSGSTTFFHTIS
jgi:hypothetical protein